MLKLLARDTVDAIDAFVEQLDRRAFPQPGEPRGCSWRSQDADGDVAAIAGGEDAKLAAAVSSLAVEPLERRSRRRSTRAACGRDCRSSC